MKLNDPASLAAWVAIAPERHRAMLQGLLRLPLFAPLIREAIEAQKARAA